MPATSAERVFVSAPAKINLCLHAGGRRSDGYHDLESLVTFARYRDRLRLERGDGLSLVLTGQFAREVTTGDDNLVMKAARALARHTQTRTGARMTLQKRIPVASGLGGGSADAAAALRGLAVLWNLDIDRESLRAIAASLGADVPVCLESGASWIEGHGERVTRLPPLPDVWLVLVNPHVPVTTAEVFANLKDCRGVGMDCPKAGFADVRALCDFLRRSANDLEAPAREIAPAIGEVLDAIRRLPEVLIARMSGSGATCFGLFASAEICSSAITALSERHAAWWVVGTGLAPAWTGAPRAVQ